MKLKEKSEKEEMIWKQIPDNYALELILWLMLILWISKPKMPLEQSKHTLTL